MTSHLSLVADAGAPFEWEPEERTRRLLEILERLHACPDIQTLHSTCVDMVERLLPGGSAALFSKEPESPVIRLAVAGHRWRSAERDAPAWLSRLTGPISSLVKAQSRVSGTLARSCDLAEVVHEGGLHLASVPVWVNGSCQISLVTLWPSPRDPDVDTWLLERVAVHVGIAAGQVSARASAESRQREAEHDQETRVRRAQLQAIGTLATKAGHAFNNTLTTVLGTTEWLLTAQELAPEVRVDVEAVHAAALDARQFVRRLQGYALRTPGQERDDEDIVTLAAAAMEAFRLRLVETGQARDGDVKVDLFEPPRPITVHVNVPEARDVIAHLLLNAAEAMPGGGRVAIRTGRRNERAWVSVADGGHGMPADVLARVFEPFFTTKGKRALGLSLSVCRDVAIANGGDLEIDSAPGRGTTATLWLPAVDAR